MNATRSSVRSGLLIGAGYFSDFHLDAWQRMQGARIIAVCDLDAAKAARAADRYGIEHCFTDVARALRCPSLDFVDIATPPTHRRELVQEVIAGGLPIICQKPLADDFPTAVEILRSAEASQQPFMVHENFRFQPWYREIKRVLQAGVIGQRLHSIYMRTRMGDGWGDAAYLSRQPYFRSMPRLLLHETGVHFVDTFRYLADNEVVECSADIRRHNPAIIGEDSGTLRLRFANGVTATWDANRYNESLDEDPRYTFGELLVEADGGSLWMNAKGQLTIKRLGESAYSHQYFHPHVGFAGDCVFACQQHFVEVLDGGLPCETSPAEYLKTLRVVEAAYVSAQRGQPIRLAPSAAGTERRIIDLSLPVSAKMRGVEILPSKSLERDGWNATTLSMYSHAGTHMDAPKHFLQLGASLDRQDLSVCCGRARVVNLAPAAPRQLLTVQDMRRAIGEVQVGDRLLLRTDWYRQYGSPQYRDALPRISIELARWLVEQKVALLGVEPPSVADVNHMPELTEVHQTLFRGGVTIVEGLANLDQLTQPEVEFIALPLRIMDGDGCPVRAIAIEQPEVIW